jgi:hypothetical protein
VHRAPEAASGSLEAKPNPDTRAASSAAVASTSCAAAIGIAHPQVMKAFQAAV